MKVLVTVTSMDDSTITLESTSELTETTISRDSGLIHPTKIGEVFELEINLKRISCCLTFMETIKTQFSGVYPTTNNPIHFYQKIMYYCPFCGSRITKENQ